MDSLDLDIATNTGMLPNALVASMYRKQHYSSLTTVRNISNSGCFE